MTAVALVAFAGWGWETKYCASHMSASRTRGCFSFLKVEDSRGFLVVVVVVVSFGSDTASAGVISISSVSVEGGRTV